MALIKLYEAANATTLYGTEVFGLSSYTFGWYMKRHDCVVFNNGAFAGNYKIFRDGTAARVCSGNGYQNSYDADRDLIYVNNWLGPTNYFTDPISLLYDPSKPARFTNNGLNFHAAFIWQNFAYRVSAFTVTKYDLAGNILGTFNVTGSITPFIADIWTITDDGILVLVDDDNGTYGVARFYDMYTSTVLHTSVFDRARRSFVDTTHKNIWSINATTGKMQTWSFDVAPSNFTAITMGANRSRYRQDDLSVTLRGSVNEPVPYWPVKWTLTTAEGHLRDEITDTDASGVATNLYCGPGADDYVGATQTITVETGY
jgi:hypothetical protein